MTDVIDTPVEVQPTDRSERAIAEIEALRDRLKAAMAECQAQTAELEATNAKMRQVLDRLEKKAKR